MARSVLAVSLLAVLGLAAGFISQSTIAGYYGASPVTDAYFVASTVPLMALNIFTSVSASVLVPLFLRAREKGGYPKAWRFAGATLWAAMGLAAVLSALSAGLAASIIGLVAPGLSGQTLDEAIVLHRLFMPIVVMFAGSAVLTATHNALGSYALPAATPLLLHMGTILGVVTLNGAVGMRGAVIGQLGGAVAQFALLGRTFGGRSSLWSTARPADLRSMGLGRLVLPALASSMIFYSPPLVERFFASALASGSITHLAIAYRVGILVYGLAGSGLATVISARLSAAAAKSDLGEATRTLSVAIRCLIVIAVPLVGLSPVYSTPFVASLFQHGRFRPDDVASVAKLAPWYVLAMSAAAFAVLLTRAFVSLLRDSLTPAWVAAFALAGYGLCCTVFAEWWGASGLAAASAVFWCSATLSAAWLLRARLAPKAGRAVVLTATCCIVAGSMSLGAADLFLSCVPRSTMSSLSATVLGATLYATVVYWVLPVGIVPLVRELRGQVPRLAGDAQCLFSASQEELN